MSHDIVADRISLTIRTGDVATLVDVLAPNVTWGPCVGRETVARWLASVVDDVELIDLAVHDDPIVLRLRRADQEIWQVAFIADGMVTEVADTAGTEDALYAEWRTAGVGGQFHQPEDTAYGLREGAHVDLDGNLLRFGSPN